jgi:hypothetical protein
MSALSLPLSPAGERGRVGWFGGEEFTEGTEGRRVIDQRIVPRQDLHGPESTSRIKWVTGRTHAR